MSKFNVGDRVVLVRAEGMAAVQGATATVVESKWSAFTYVKWDRNSAAGRQSDGGYEHDRFQKIEPKKPRQSKPKASDTKIAKLRSHLLAGRSITQLEAIALYSAFRLAARIHDLKAEGMKIDTIMKEDPNGSPYAEYRLRSKKVR
ncbi:helix-turn-helix domain-containing protein [Shinella zoogloeoides]|uniref:helix-turn-helix domain-containing protein n=1 Tax=Shinella zoogloeoides TaxID=352475 RepID=UPI0028B1B5C8|nr:helix-turn-helix domain-containing protein [Shinella zoogloeoides]